jgi:hypothetical protein
MADKGSGWPNSKDDYELLDVIGLLFCILLMPFVIFFYFREH